MNVSNIITAFSNIPLIREVEYWGYDNISEESKVLLDQLDPLTRLLAKKVPRAIIKSKNGEPVERKLKQFDNTAIKSEEIKYGWTKLSPDLESWQPSADIITKWKVTDDLTFETLKEDGILGGKDTWVERFKRRILSTALVKMLINNRLIVMNSTMVALGLC